MTFSELHIHINVTWCDWKLRLSHSRSTIFTHREIATLLTELGTDKFLGHDWDSSWQTGLFNNGEHVWRKFEQFLGKGPLHKTKIDADITYNPGNISCDSWF